MSFMVKKSVLIIEDEKSMLEDIKFVFEKNKSYNFEVVGTGSAKDAISILKEIEQGKDKEPFDIIIIDIRLQEKRGGVVLQELMQYTKSGRSIKIVFTGWPSDKDCIECMRYGAWDYIVKGKNKGSIQQVADSAVSRLKRLEELEERHKYYGEKWLMEHFKEIEEKYSNQYIAILDDKIVCSAPDLISLKEEIKNKGFSKEPYISHLTT